MKTKILVVDDENDLELLIRQRFRNQIKEGVYEFYFAENGKIALEIMCQQPEISMVLSDINMPEMDGLSLLVKLNETNPLVKVVMVSAYGDMNNIRNAMNQRAYDFICKPIRFDDLEATMEKTIEYIGHIRNSIETLKQNHIFKSYDDSVVNFLTRNEFEKSIITSETIEGSVLIANIHGFALISEKKPADYVVKLINKYFDIMAKEVKNNQGKVDKFMGDTFMAVFENDKHLENSLKASLAILSKIENLKDPADELSEIFPNVAIGVASGSMHAGNLGSSDFNRIDYSVIGDVVNYALRLPAISTKNQVLINENDFEMVKNNFRCNELVEISLGTNQQKCFEVVEILK